MRMEVREEDGAEETRVKVEGIVVGEGIAVGVAVGLVEVEVVIVVGAVYCIYLLLLHHEAFTKPCCTKSSSQSRLSSPLESPNSAWAGVDLEYLQPRRSGLHHLKDLERHASAFLERQTLEIRPLCWDRVYEI